MNFRIGGRDYGASHALFVAAADNFRPRVAVAGARCLSTEDACEDGQGGDQKFAEEGVAFHARDPYAGLMPRVG